MKKVTSAWVALVVMVLIGVGFYLYHTARPEPYDVVFRNLKGLIPRDHIVYAQQVESGLDPTFIAVVTIDARLDVPAILKELGVSPTPYSQKMQDVKRVMSWRFQHYPDFPNESSFAGFDAWAGSLQGKPFYMSALVSRTNAFLILNRY